MGGRAAIQLFCAVVTWTYLSEQLIIRPPRIDRSIFNPIAGLIWLQFVSRTETVDYRVLTPLEISKNKPWVVGRKSCIAAGIYLLFGHILELRAMTREQDAHCIILSVLLTMKFFAVISGQVLLIDVCLLVAVFWVMAGCPHACAARVSEIYNMVVTVSEQRDQLLVVLTQHNDLLMRLRIFNVNMARLLARKATEMWASDLVMAALLGDQVGFTLLSMTEGPAPEDSETRLLSEGTEKGNAKHEVY